MYALQTKITTPPLPTYRPPILKPPLGVIKNDSMTGKVRGKERGLVWGCADLTIKNYTKKIQSADHPKTKSDQRLGKKLYVYSPLGHVAISETRWWYVGDVKGVIEIRFDRGPKAES